MASLHGDLHETRGTQAVNAHHANNALPVHPAIAALALATAILATMHGSCLPMNMASPMPSGWRPLQRDPLSSSCHWAPTSLRSILVCLSAKVAPLHAIEHAFAAALSLFWYLFFFYNLRSMMNMEKVQRVPCLQVARVQNISNNPHPPPPLACLQTQLCVRALEPLTSSVSEGCCAFSSSICGICVCSFSGGVFSTRWTPGCPLGRVQRRQLALPRCVLSDALLLPVLWSYRGGGLTGCAASLLPCWRYISIPTQCPRGLRNTNTPSRYTIMDATVLGSVLLYYWGRCSKPLRVPLTTATAC